MDILNCTEKKRFSDEIIERYKCQYYYKHKFRHVSCEKRIDINQSVQGIFITLLQFCSHTLSLAYFYTSVWSSFHLLSSNSRSVVPNEAELPGC